MDMKEEKEPKSLTKTVKEILDLSEESLGIIASPNVLWLIVLLNAWHGSGFSGYVSNPSRTGKELE